MTSWLRRTEAGIQSAPTTSLPSSALLQPQTPRFKDPNAPDHRLEVESTCIYERKLPGNAYITAHVTRLQAGYYDTPSTHGVAIDNIRFLAVNFVFHPSETINRFRSAVVKVRLYDDTNQSYTDPVPDSHRLSVQGLSEPQRKPKFLRFAPHVMYGTVSPETLDWNFNLTGSLGVSHTPVAASVSPSGGWKSSYKVYQMMRIQGSTRTARSSPFNEPSYDIEDGEVVWTMEENPLQKSGLPREMTFVMLITKGDVENVVFDINIEPKVATRFGSYPKFLTNFIKYQPLQKEHVDLDRQIGQRFTPVVPGQGFNFAGLAGSFNEFVSLPGTTYSLTDQATQAEVGTVPRNGKQPASFAARMLDKPQAESKSLQPPVFQLAIIQTQQAGQTGSTQAEPMDYHIFLHNPRSINLHATPPPPCASAPLGQQSLNLFNPLSASDPIPRARTTLPDRTRSPANTKTKRRSIDITYIGQSEIPGSGLGIGVRKVSPGSLRRRNSQTDLRSSPLPENSPSDRSDSTSNTSISFKKAQKENVPPIDIQSSSPPAPIAYPSHSPDILIPMEAPSPPNALNSHGPSMPAWRGSTSRDNKLPFELNKPVRPPIRRDSSSGSGRQFKTRGSPSPLRARREITPSPGEELVDLNFTTIPAEFATNRSRALQEAVNSSRRERDVSPYAAAALANGVGLKKPSDEPWDESKGDLKELRARKRYSLPAQYSYIQAEEDADRDWDER